MILLNLFPVLNHQRHFNNIYAVFFSSTYIPPTVNACRIWLSGSGFFLLNIMLYNFLHFAANDIIFFILVTISFSLFIQLWHLLDCVTRLLWIYAGWLYNSVAVNSANMQISLLWAESVPSDTKKLSKVSVGVVLWPGFWDIHTDPRSGWTNLHSHQ